MGHRIPSVGQWYRDITANRLLEIIAIDEYTATISIQYENTEIDELELAQWAELSILLSNPPEDWRAWATLNDQDRAFCDSIVDMTPSNSRATEIKPDKSFGWDEL